MQSLKKRMLLGTARSAYTALLLLSVATTASAAELEVDDDLTTPLKTSTAVNGSPGDITIESDGSIEVGTGPAVTIDSNHDVVNEGTIELTTDTNGVGVRILGGTSGSFTNKAIMNLLVDDSNGVATGSGNIGVEIVGPGTYGGDVIFSSNSTLSVGGDNSIGVAVRTTMSEKLTLGGSLVVTGSNVTGILVESAVNDRIKVEGAISARGENARGLWIISDVSDRLWNNGSISVTAQENGVSYDVDDLRPSAGAALGIGASLGRGFQNGGLIDESTGTTAASISASYAPYAVLVSPTLSATLDSITLSAPGGTGGDYGFLNRGSISSSAGDKGENTTTVRLEGYTSGGSIYQTTIAGGFYSSGSISAGAVEGTATALSFGDYASSPIFMNKGSIGASVSEYSESDEDDPDDLVNETGMAIALQIDALATMPDLQNTGTIKASVAADTAFSYAIRDLSGTLTNIYNAGEISASVSDDDDTDDSRAIAIDLSLAASSTITTPGTIRGDILLGNGNDVVSLVERVQGSSGDDDLDGALVVGVIEFNGGDDTLTIEEDGHFYGGTTKTSGTLDIDVIDGRITVAKDAALYATDLTISASSDLVIALDEGNITQPRVQVANAATFDDGATVSVDVRSFAGDTANITLVDAGTINFTSALDNFVSTDLPYIYNGSFSLVDGARDQLLLSLDLKSAQELGLSEQEAAMYDAVFEIMGTEDNVLGDLLTSATDGETFLGLYDELQPDTSAATLYTALSNSDARRRALLTRHLIQPEGGKRDRDTAIWIDGFAHNVSIDSTSNNAGASGDAVGIFAATDLDAQLRSPVGFYMMFSGSSLSPEGNALDETRSDSFEGGVYGIWHLSGFFASVDTGLGYTHNRNSRRLSFDQDNDGTADAIYDLSSDWNAFSYHLDGRVGLTAVFSGLRVIPSAGYSYLQVNEGEHTEEGGDVGFNLIYDEFSAGIHRLDAELSIGQIAEMSRGTVLAYDVFGGFKQTLSGAENEISARFSGGTETFSLPLTDLPGGQMAFGANIGLYGSASTVSATYEVDVADGSLRHGGSLNLKFKF